MAGKSTFLRIIGVNAVLAQTLSTCTALRYEADCFVILSSLAVDDDLRAGRSRYYAEAERLLTMIQSAQKERATLCLIDEILRGTNTTERIAAATEILRYLADSGATTLAATHDTDIAVDLGSLFETLHFSVRDDDGRMQFDHRPEPGISTSRNAIRMLSALGFPEEIVDAALGRVAARETGA
jgi:DNA mismatch repair ATPase MutS